MAKITQDASLPASCVILAIIKENIIMAKITQDAGREALGEFAPQFAHFNDDVLFGENWNNEDIDISSGRRNI